MFTVASLPRRVGPARSGSSCIQLVQIKAQESQGSGRGPWTHRMDHHQPISSQRVLASLCPTVGSQIGHSPA